MLVNLHFTSTTILGMEETQGVLLCE